MSHAMTMPHLLPPKGREPHPVEFGGAVAVTDAEIRCLKQPSLRDEVALLVTHSPDGQWKPHVRHYLDSLRRQGIAVVLIMNADEPLAATDAGSASRADGIFVRRNEGY